MAVLRYTEVVDAARGTVAKMLADRHVRANLHVNTAGGTTASVSVSGNRVEVSLPSIPPATVLTRAEADRFVGYLVHETAHVLHTHWPAWLDACRQGQTVRNLTNAIEDVRIEKLEADGPFGGFQSLMQALTSHLCAEADADAAKLGHVIGSRSQDLAWIIAAQGRATCNGLDLPAAGAMYARVPAPLRKIADFALAQIPTLNSTHDARQLAVILEGMLDKANAQEDARADRAARKRAQDRDKAASQGEGEGQDEGESQGQGEGEGQGQGELAQGQGGSGAAANHDNKVFSAQPVTSASDTMAAVVEKMKGRGVNVQTTIRARAYLAGLSGFKVKGALHMDRGGAASPEDIARCRALMPRSAALQDQIGQLVISHEVRQRERRLTSGRMDRRGMSRAAMGAANVYARRHVTPGIDTAVTLLLDLSGSMGGGIGSKMDVAACMALHIAEAVELAGGQVQVLGFGSPGTANEEAGLGCTIHVLKAYYESLKTTARNIVGINPPYGTPLAPAVIAAARMALSVEADRYILGVLTDGECSYGADGVRDGLAMVDALGVEPFGLGVQHNASAAFQGFPYTTVKDLKELPRTGLRQVLRAMQGPEA